MRRHLFSPIHFHSGGAAGIGANATGLQLPEIPFEFQNRDDWIFKKPRRRIIDHENRMQ